MPNQIDSRCDLRGDCPCFISSSSAASGCITRDRPELHVGDFSSFVCCCCLVVRRRQQMARSATSRARPTTPPVTPPAIVAVLGVGTGLMVCPGWGAVVAADKLSVTEIEVNVFTSLVDVGTDAGEGNIGLDVQTSIVSNGK